MSSVSPDEPEAQTCGDAFNNAWQCYSPTFQMTRYYRYGELDSCEGRWDAIWACMDSRKRSGQGLSSKAPVIADAKEERAKPYWNLMDPKEAGARWRKQFGDKVPTENELAERDRATSSEETKSSWFF